jgi:hypothetical protein
LIYFEEDRYVPNCPIVTCGRQNALTQVWTLNEHISTPVDNEKLLDVIQQSAKPSLPQQKEDTLPPVTIPEASTLVPVAVEDDKSAAEYSTDYPTFIDAEVQTDQVEAQETAVVDVDTQTSSATIEDFPLHPDPIVAPIQHSDSQIRPVDNEDLTQPIVHLLSPEPAVTPAHTIDYKDMYDNTCRQFSAMHRRVRGLISSRAVLQRENVRLVDQLEIKNRELEEEIASSSKNLKDLESEHSANLEKMRGFHNTLLENRNIKIAELEQTISDLNQKLDDFEDDSRTEMQETRKRYSVVIRKHNEYLQQLESRIEELTKHNTELNLSIDELELASFSLPNYYKLLGVERGKASKEKVQSCFRNKIRPIHPDKMKPDADEKALAKAKALGEALHRGRLILSDPNLKEHYDEWIDMIDIKNAEDRIREYEANEARYAERYWNKY